jgi:hypothetical protein
LTRSLASGAVNDMVGSSPRAAHLSTLTVARARRFSVECVMPRHRTARGEMHLGIVSMSQLDVPRGADGEARGVRYGLVAVDDYSGRGWVYFGHWLNELGTPANFGAHISLGHGYTSRRVHADGGPNLQPTAVEKLLAEFGMQCTVTSAPHTPESNSVAERYIQTLLGDTRAHGDRRQPEALLALRDAAGVCCAQHACVAACRARREARARLRLAA